MTGSLFERLGGFARVRLMVSEFYDRVLNSERLSVYFQDLDMRRLIDHQTKFIAAVMGGPASFTDEQISRAHVRLEITAEEFDEMAELLRDTLEDFAVDPSSVARLHAHVQSLRSLVVAGSNVPAS